MYVRPCVAFRERRVFFPEAKLFREKRSCSVFLFFGMHLPSQLGGGERNLSSNPQKQCPEIENLLSSLVFFRMWEKAFESLLLFYRINSVAAASFSALFQIFALPPLPIQHKRSPALSLDRVSQTGICNLHKIFLPEKKEKGNIRESEFCRILLSVYAACKVTLVSQKKKLYGRRKAKPSLFTFRGRGC